MADGGGGRAIPFIVPAGGGGGGGGERFTVAPEALRLLESLDGTPVAPIAVCGRYRSGKSFLLNRLVGACRARGFEVGSTIEACTRGIWLWSEPTDLVLSDGSPVKVLFMDTEGLGAYGASSEHDARVFALAVLLSSLVVYNSVGAIDEDAIQQLAFVANLSKHIQLKASSGPDAGAGGGDDGQLSVLSGGASSALGGESRADSDADSEDDDEDAHGGYAAALRSRSGAGGSGGGGSGGARAAPAGPAAAAGAKPLAPAAAATGASVPPRSSSSTLGAPRRPQLPAPSSSSEQQRFAADFFPSFLWVLRDFVLGLVDEDTGAPLSAKDYLEACLAPSGGGATGGRGGGGGGGGSDFSSDAQARARTRRVLTTFFRERACETLVRPVDSEAELQAVDTLPDAALRPRFRKELRHLRRRVLGELVRPKAMAGEALCGRVLGALAVAYVEALNAGGVPEISNAWDGVTRVECERACDAAARAFAAALEAAAGPTALPMDEGALRGAYDGCARAAAAAYDARAVGPAAAKYRGDLAARVAGHWDALRAANIVVSESACRTLAARLWAVHIEARVEGGGEVEPAGRPAASAAAQPSGSSGSGRRRGSAPAPLPPASAPPGAAAAAPDAGCAYVAQPDLCTADLAAFGRAYHAAARGPAVHSALASHLLAALPQLVRAVGAGGRSAADARVRGLHAAADAGRLQAAEAAARCVALDGELQRLRGDRDAAATAGAGAAAAAAGAEGRAAALTARVRELERELKRQAPASGAAAGAPSVGPLAGDAAAPPKSARRRPSQLPAAGAAEGGVFLSHADAASAAAGAGAASAARSSGSAAHEERRRSRSAAPGRAAARDSRDRGSREGGDEASAQEDAAGRLGSAPAHGAKASSSNSSGPTSAGSGRRASAGSAPPERGRAGGGGSRLGHGGTRGGGQPRRRGADSDASDDDARGKRAPQGRGPAAIEFPEPVPRGGSGGCGPGSARGGGGSGRGGCSVQ